MNKFLISIAVLLMSSPLLAAPSSQVKLSGHATINPTADLNLSLASILKGAYYTLTCEFTNNQSEALDMRFEPNASSTSYGQVTLNGATLVNLQGSLESGSNTLVIDDITNKGNNASLLLKNLDLKHSVEITHCSAKPAIKKLSADYGGSFIAYNDTAYFIDITVGNFFPTPYTIYPFASRWINVSTNNQNIAIKGIY